MPQNETLLTYEGLKKLEEELEYLKTQKRKEIAERIKVALGFGDLSENSEYDEAKNAQAENEIKIATMFICALTNSEKIMLILFMSPKSNTNAPIRVAMPIRNGISSFNHICFLDLK